MPEQTSIEIPETFTIYDKTVPTPDRWWEGFGSAELNRLVGEALDDGFSIRTALARLKQANALAVQATAERLPDLELEAGASDTWKDSGSGTTMARSRSLTLVSNYEIDFWGRASAEEKSALLNLEASREDLYTAALTLASEVTDRWLELVSVRQQIGLLHKQMETSRTILNLMELRYLKGLATALDIYQQRQSTAEIESSFPQLESRLQTLLHELAVLVGKPPLTDLELTANTFPEPGALPRTGVPAELLSKRPDVRAVGLELRAAGEQVAAARAERLPAMSITGSAGFSSEGLSDLLERWIVSLAASLTYPILDSGSRDAEVKRREAVVQEQLASYEGIVLGAVREVEDAMVREVKQTEYISALEKQLKISRDGLREAESRYRKGLNDYLPVLTALTSTHRLERSIVQAKYDRLTYRVALYRALGGDWMEEKYKNQ